GMARLYIREGRFDKSRELLDPLLTRKRMHASELNALCIAEIELGLAQGRPDTARSWVEMLQRGDPDNPNLPELRRRVREATRQGR
ncbi:hypothetical protein, partial [Klebsiella pneumoniae]|uniref:hypothetical protein n=1 Tax=Klebsiella pneumoniae TaxID=573 RepID=UPI0030137963